jgi:hypothetical protein
MIEFLFLILGFLFFLLDTAIVPALGFYAGFADISLLYCFYLYDTMKEKSLYFFIVILLIKAVLVPREILLPFILLYLAGFLSFLGIRSVTKIANLVSIGLPGFLFFSIEFFVIKKPSFSTYLSFSLLQIFLWLSLTPVLAFLSTRYHEKIKGKGVFV